MTNTPRYIDDVHAIVARWSNCGEQRLSDGTLLIGRIQSKGVGAYLHRLFSPLTPEEILNLTELVRAELPYQLAEFYKFHNGCNLFESNITVYGLRRSLDRSDFDAVLSNPFDLRVQSLTHRQDSPSGNGFCFSKYQDDTLIFIENDGSVVRCSEGRDSKILNAWPSFPVWLVSELERFGRFYDHRGETAYQEDEMVPPSWLV